MSPGLDLYFYRSNFNTPLSFQLPVDPSSRQLAPSVAAAIDFDLDMEYCVSARRRVVSFVQIWMETLGLQFFLDPAANSFVEELFCLVLEDHRRFPGMSGVLHRMTTLRQIREEAMKWAELNFL